MLFPKINYLISVVFLLFVSTNASAIVTDNSKEQEADRKISQLYLSLEKNVPASKNMQFRLDAISSAFLGKTYILGSLGEGATAPYDQFPQYRSDAFDCETYVTTVLAIAKAENVETFKQRLRELRYINNQNDYIQRNHFTELDWNLNNAKKGFVKDITKQFKDKEGKPIYKTATVLINKPAWYQFKKSLRLTDGSSEEVQKARLNELKAKGAKLPQTYSRLPYLPFSILFSKDGSPNNFLFSQIPNAAIVEIVRPNWQLSDKIGTNLNVSHLGFVFWKKGILMFREASTIHGKVVDVPLIEYLIDARKSPTIQGINVQVVL